MRWHNEYNVGTLQRPGADGLHLARRGRGQDRLRRRRGLDHRHARRSGEDDQERCCEVSGGVGTIVGFVHDWANPENTRRSWDMVARYVVPEINGYLDGLRKSQKFVIENRAVFERAGQAVMAKIMENERPQLRCRKTGPGRVAIPAVNAPDLQKEAAKRKA